MAPRYQRSEFYQPVKVGSGKAELYGTLSARLSEFAGRAKEIGERIAIPQAEQAGTEAGLAGETKLRAPITAQNRAYNDALVRAYALDAYADVNEKMAQFEIEAGTDVQKFKASVEGYRNGLLPAMLPQAAPIVQGAMLERETEGAIRIGNLKAQETHAEAVAQSDRGLGALQDQISRLYTSGDPLQVERAEKMVEIYLNVLEDDVEAGLRERRAANAKRDLMFKDVARQVAIGGLERELAKPGGDPISEIEQVLERASPLLSDSERIELVGSMFARLNAHQALETERQAQFKLDTQAQWAAGEKQATQMLLRGQLTMGIIDTLVTTDRLDPAIARSMRLALKEGADLVSDPEVEFIYRSNALDFSVQEIRDEPRLSWEDKTSIIAMREQQSKGWRDTNAAQEAASRIDRALGIVPGTLMAALPDEKKTQRGRALSSWWDQVEALPEGEREARVIEVANKVIVQVIQSNAELEVERLRAIRDAYVRNNDVRDMGPAKKQQYENELQRLDAAIEAERRKGTKK